MCLFAKHYSIFRNNLTCNIVHVGFWSLKPEGSHGIACSDLHECGLVAVFGGYVTAKLNECVNLNQKQINEN